MKIIGENRYRPLGNGRFYPAGSAGDLRVGEIVSSYKREIAGTYVSVLPEAIRRSISPGRPIVSTKVDGEQWFLMKDDGGAYLISPSGKVITGIEATEEAESTLRGWRGLLAGELYAAVDEGRPRVYDLHFVLGGGVDAETGRIRFAAFDLLVDGESATDDMPFSSRAHRIEVLLSGGTYVHPVDFTEMENPEGIESFFRSQMENNAEGIVVRCDDGRIWKIKPKISIDAAVVGYTASINGIHDLLLGLMAEDGSVQLIGRVDTGFSAAERKEFLDRLSSLSCGSALHLTSRSGIPYTWVKPEVVVEVTCHELLTIKSDGEPIRRPRVLHSPDIGWSPLGKHPSMSMRDAVFERVRDDKTVNPVDVPWSQVTDMVTMGGNNTGPLPASEIIRREVYAKRVKSGGMAVRKLLAWKTNKDAADPRYPAYAAMFTDYSPNRLEPLRTAVKTASTLERLMETVRAWLDEHTGRGWECVSSTGVELPDITERTPSIHGVPAGAHTLTISFARSTSPTFPIVRRRLDGFSDIGELHITTDDSGKESWFELSITAGIVEHFRRITNLLSLVRRWKSTEVSLDGETLDKYGIDDAVNRIEEIRKCWMRRKSSGPAGCMKDTAVGCRCLSIIPSERFLIGAYITEPQWYTVGRFDGRQVNIDKEGLINQIDRRKNRLLECCPHFSKDRIRAAIHSLPDALSPDEAGYILVHRRDDGAPAWVWPEHAPLPPRLVERRASTNQHGQREHGVYIGDIHQSLTSTASKPRHIPPATYTDVCGQDEAVEAVRDMIELPMKHAHLFEAVGSPAKPGGIILAGPPGTGKTLLARAVAGECGAHLEVVSGPELLNPYVGATEQGLREVFARAAKHAPSIILFDEIDSIAPSRATADAHHQQSMVAQLLTLLDGLESRTGVSVLATTNRPESIDPALRRPGRFDQVVWMRLPDERGRAAILGRYLMPLKLDSSIDVEALAAELAAITDGASGADLEYLCQTAAKLCVKEAILLGTSPDGVRISAHHFDLALSSLGCALGGSVRENQRFPTQIMG
ncbi:MAG: AAA family ATPase [Armatimonadota bacterium]